MNKIVNILKEKKSLPLDKFIKIALYDKKYGYYMKTNPFGKRGDFITAPMVSPLFGEMISIWCVLFWEHLNKPKKILLVELGPGDGTLCKELLKNFKQFSEFNNCLEINLLEISKKLKKIQKLKIKDKKVKWIKKIRDVNYGPVIFLANEFFDSLPIKQIYKKNNFFFEKHIVMSKNSKKFKFTLKKVKKKVIKKIKNLK
jgi:cyclopropane-fatty-acyl-phospholipid synthase